MKHIATLLGATLLLAGCSESGVNIRGNVAVGGSGKTLVVERVTPTGSRFVDSLRIGRQGNFSLFVKQQADVPEFYTLRIAGGGSVPLLAEVPEKIVVRIADSTASEYTVTGSEGSVLVQEANAILTHMWPLAVHMPRSREAIAVNLADKLCAILEVACIYRTRRVQRWLPQPC